MESVRRWLELLYDRKISREYDRIVILLGDEGKGKSTLGLHTTVHWHDFLDRSTSPEAIVNTVAWDREDFKNALVDAEPQSVIHVPDAARVLHKKKAMRSEQIELETDLLDTRMKSFLILLGYQDWRDVASQLQRRRAKNVLHIPRRGSIRGFNRKSMDHRIEEGKWPEADLTDTFPSLDGTKTWRLFRELDLEKKEERMRGDSDEETENEVSENERLKAIAAEIRNGSLSDFVREHAGNGTLFIAPELIELEYDLSQRQAKKVKLLLESEDLEAAISSASA